MLIQKQTYATSANTRSASVLFNLSSTANCLSNDMNGKKDYCHEYITAPSCVLLPGK